MIALKGLLRSCAMMEKNLSFCAFSSRSFAEYEFCEAYLTRHVSVMLPKVNTALERSEVNNLLSKKVDYLLTRCAIAF